MHCSICDKSFPSALEHRNFIFLRRSPSSATMSLAGRHGYTHAHASRSVTGFAAIASITPFDFYGFVDGVYFLKSPAHEMYVCLVARWSLEDEKSSWRCTEDREYIANRADVAADIQKWMFRICEDSEASSVFLLMIASFGKLDTIYRNNENLEELMNRLADIFELPKYWEALTCE